MNTLEDFPVTIEGKIHQLLVSKIWNTTDKDHFDEILHRKLACEVEVSTKL